MAINIGENQNEQVTYVNSPDINRVLFKNLKEGASKEDIADAVNDWLDDHPEATTTVEDGSILPVKLDSTNSASDGYVLSYNATAGKFEWVDIQSDITELKTDLTLSNTALFGDVDDTFPLSFENGTYQSVSVGSTLVKYYDGGYDKTRKVVKSTVFNAPCNVIIKSKTGYSFTVFTSNGGIITGTSGLVTEYTMISGKQYGMVLRATGGTDDISAVDVSSIIDVEYDSITEELRKDFTQLDADIFGNNRIKNGSFKVRNAGTSSSPNFTFSDGSFKMRRASTVVGNGATIYFSVPEGVETKNYTCILNVSGGNADAGVYVRGYAQEPDTYNASPDELYGAYSDITSINDTIEFTIGNNINYVGIYINVKTGQVDYVNGTLFFALSNEVGAIQEVKNDTAQEINEATTDINDALFGIEFVTPPVVNICGGIEQNFYYQNMIMGFNTEKAYSIETSAKTTNYNQFARLSPSDSTSLQNNGFKVYLYPYNKNKRVSSDTISYNVVPKSSGSGLTKKVLLIGDSLTFNQPMSKHLVDDLLASDAMTVSLIGTLGSAPYLREGRSGWSAHDYVSGYEHGDSFTNAFWNPSTNKFDFSYYMSNNSFSDVDYVFINLGTNLGANTVDSMADDLEEMITSIHAYDPNIRVGVWTPPPRGLMGNGFLTDNDNTLLRVKAIINKFKNRTGERIYVVPVTLNVDPYHDFPYETVNVSSRNSSFQMVVATDRTHPADAGYYKMADVIYNYIKYFGSLDAT